jgi:hypothetical protein
MYLTSSFPHFHRPTYFMACGNVENFCAEYFFNRWPEISTAISTGAVENKPFHYNSKVTFPHFHRPYYYY